MPHVKYHDATHVRKREAARRFRAAHPGYFAKLQAKYQKKHPEKAKTARLKDWRRVREAVIALLGGACEICGLTNYEYLTLDHRAGDGAKHRASRNGRNDNTFVYRDILSGKEDVRRFRLLCWNHNCALGMHGVAPNMVYKHGTST